MDKFSIPKHFFLPMALRKLENQPKSNRGNSAEAHFYSLWYDKTHNLSLWCVDATSRGHVRWTYGSHHTQKKKSQSFQILHACFHPNNFQSIPNQCARSCDVLFPDRGRHRAPSPLSPLNNMLLTFHEGSLFYSCLHASSSPSFHAALSTQP